MDLPEVLGTVAGEDTLLAVVAEGYNPVQVKEKLRRLVSER
jgi:arginine repressor